jgi:AGZA family xanthine/uracil permease-like MFS transporter
VVDTPGVLVGLGDLKSPPVMLTVIGTLITMGLYTKNIKGSILLGMLITCFVGILLNVVSYTGVVSAIPKIDATFMKLDIAGAFKAGIITVVFTFFFLDVFDTMGTLIGVTSQAGYIKDGKLPRANKAMLADAVGTVGGALLGTSTVTSYIESSTGIAQGGRTGFSSIVTGVLFLVALFFSPLAEMIGGGYMVGDTQLYPVIAPALIVVGFLMMKSIGQINWNEVTEALPAFVVIITMPLTFSITDGIGFGIITYTFLMVVAKKSKEIHWLLYLITFLFLARYILT